MNILIIDESINRVGGVERIVSVIANELIKKNNVDIISEYRCSEAPFYDYNKNINIKYLIDSRKYKTNNLKEKNLKYYFYRVFEKIMDKVFLRKKIKKETKNFCNYDIIIFGRVFTAIDFFDKITDLNRNYKVFVRDAIHLEYYSKKIRRKMIKYFPKFVDKFIISSDESKKTYKKFFENKNVEYVKIYNPLGIKPECNYNFNNKTISSIGRYDNQKGFDNLIRAFSYVYDNHKDWKLKIYGNGNYENNLKKIISECNLEDSVQLLPTSKDVAKIFMESSIFVLASRYEGYANILVEALACGMPSITYNWLMGAEEIIDDKKNGIIVELKDRFEYFYGKDNQEDIINLANAINYLIENPEVCNEFSKKALDIIETRNVEIIIKKWIQLIDNEVDKID